MGTIADKTLYLQGTKQAIHDAIVAKGVNIPIGSTFRSYATKISDITSGSSCPTGSSGPLEWTQEYYDIVAAASAFEWTQEYYDSVVTATTFVRPAEWLPLPAKVQGEQKFVGLKAVFNTDSEIIDLTAGGNYTIDWGDGVVENYNSGGQASHKYTYSSISDTVKSDGSKQVIVTIAPQAEQSLTYVNLNKRNALFVNVVESGFLDIRVHTAASAFPIELAYSITGATSVYLNSLKIVEWTSDGFTGTSLAYLFTGLSRLESVLLPDTTTVTRMDSMFQNCSALQTVPLFITTAVTNMQAMFTNCSALQTVPLFNTVAVTSMQAMFQNCSALQTVPLFITTAVTRMDSMFSYCSTLQTAPLFNTAAVTSMQSMFSGCVSLQTVPLFNTAAVTNMSYMFSGCVSLQTVPLFITTTVTSMQGMFNSCTSLQTVPALIVSASTVTTSMFNGCYSLSNLDAANFRATFSIANCKLSAVALNKIYTDLPTVTGKTITVTENYGTSSDNPSIATSKGWTVTG